MLETLLSAGSKGRTTIPYPGPGLTEVVYGDLSLGFAGRVNNDDLPAPHALAQYLKGITLETSFGNKEHVWIKYVIDERVLIVPSLLMARSITFKQVWESGVAYAEEPTYRPTTVTETAQGRIVTGKDRLNNTWAFKPKLLSKAEFDGVYQHSVLVSGSNTQADIWSPELADDPTIAMVTSQLSPTNPAVTYHRSKNQAFTAGTARTHTTSGGGMLVFELVNLKQLLLEPMDFVVQTSIDTDTVNPTSVSLVRPLGVSANSADDTPEQSSYSSSTLTRPLGVVANTQDSTEYFSIR